MDQHRRAAYEHLGAALGEEGARAITAMLPPSRSASRFDALDARLDTLQAVTVSSRQLGLTMIAAVTAIGALAVTLAALLA